MIIYVDIDGTICDTEGSDYKNTKPRQNQIDKINKLYDEGNTIIYWTARGSLTGINWFSLTERQLKKWGVNYHKIFFSKPSYDYIIDDKSIYAKKILKKGIQNKLKKYI